MKPFFYGEFMTDLTLPSNTQTMTSLDLRDIINSVRQQAGESEIRLNKLNEKIADELEGEHYTKSVVKNDNGTESEVYNLTIDQCTLVGMRESKSVRRNVLAKLKELESTQPKLPQTFAEALQLAADQALQIEQQEQQLALAAPKVDFYDTVTGSDDTVDMLGAVKVLNLGYGRTTLFKKLREKKVLRKNNQPYQRYIDSGYFRVVESTWTDDKGDSHVHLKTVVYQKGLDYIKKILSK